MKKILILILTMLVLASTAFAVSDLVIEDFALKANTIEPKGKYHYTLSVKNIGDETAQTGLRAWQWFETQEQSMQPNKLLSLYAEGRNFNVVQPILVTDEAGLETMKQPVFEELTYVVPAESPAKIQERKDSFLERANSLDYTEEQIQEGLENIEITFSQRRNVTTEEIYINLEPGETAVYDSELSYNGFGALSFPVGLVENDWPVLSTEPIDIGLNIQLAPFNLNEDLTNNHFETVVTMQPNVLQGPLPATETNKKLKDETEYFSLAGGCGIINTKDICVYVENEEADDMDEILTVEVDGQKQFYPMHSLFTAWLYNIFGDGQLAQSKTINGVKVKLYYGGIKFDFN